MGYHPLLRHMLAKVPVNWTEDLHLTWLTFAPIPSLTWLGPSPVTEINEYRRLLSPMIDGVESANYLLLGLRSSRVILRTLAALHCNIRRWCLSSRVASDWHLEMSFLRANQASNDASCSKKVLSILTFNIFIPNENIVI